MRRFGLFGGAVVWALTASTVLATPSSGITPLDLARGTSAAAYTITHTANRDIMTQTLTFAPGATTGWHTHPGSVVVIVQSGTLSFWDSMDCALETYTAGQALVVPGASMFDLARNDDATVPLVLVVTYYDVPVGGAQTIPAAAQCTGTPGVPQDVGASGITPVTHTRTRLAAALNVTGPANTDLMIQQLTFAAGATTGWHSHYGPLTVAIESGELRYVHADCTSTLYPAGTAFLDTTMTHQATSAGVTVAFVTYTNVPVGVSPRVDQPAPACTDTPAPTAAPTATPAALPDTASGEHAGEGSTSIALVAGLIATLLATILGTAGWRRRAG